MGLDMKNTTTRLTKMRAEKMPTSSHLVPEKLPWLQLWRFTMSESRAKVMRNSVTAEQI